LGLTNLPLYREKVRPIKVLVIDGFNSKPVENAIVYYCIKTVRVKNILGIPMIAPFDYRDVVRKQFYTDKNGCIYLPQQKVYLKLYEKVFREYIYINLDLIEKTGKKEEYFKILLPEKWVTAEERQKSFEDFSTQDDHLMHITGIVKDQLGNLYFDVKNSWGTENLGNAGHVYMSFPYIRMKSICFLVHKDALSKELKMKLGIQ